MTARMDKTRTKEKDFVTRLADAGEEALQRIADLLGDRRHSRPSTTSGRVWTSSPRRCVASTSSRRAWRSWRKRSLRSRRRRRRRGGRRLASLLARSRNAQPEGARHDLEAHGCRPRLLAIELDRKRL